MFLEKNIIRISHNSIKKAKECSLFLVYYEKYKNQIDDIIKFGKKYGRC